MASASSVAVEVPSPACRCSRRLPRGPPAGHLPRGRMRPRAQQQWRRRWRRWDGARPLLGDADVTALRADDHAHPRQPSFATPVASFSRVSLSYAISLAMLSPFLEHVRNDIAARKLALFVHSADAGELFMGNGSVSLPIYLPATPPATKSNTSQLLRQSVELRPWRSRGRASRPAGRNSRPRSGWRSSHPARRPSPGRRVSENSSACRAAGQGDERIGQRGHASYEWQGRIKISSVHGYLGVPFLFRPSVTTRLAAAARVTHSVRHRAHQAHVMPEHQAVPVLAQRASARKRHRCTAHPNLARRAEHLSSWRTPLVLSTALPRVHHHSKDPGAQTHQG